jgi:hypothetical protein
MITAGPCRADIQIGAIILKILSCDSIMTYYFAIAHWTSSIKLLGLGLLILLDTDNAGEETDAHSAYLEV